MAEVAGESAYVTHGVQLMDQAGGRWRRGKSEPLSAAHQQGVDPRRIAARLCSEVAGVVDSQPNRQAEDRHDRDDRRRESRRLWKPRDLGPHRAREAIDHDQQEQSQDERLKDSPQEPQGDPHQNYGDDNIANLQSAEREGGLRHHIQRLRTGYGATVAARYTNLQARQVAVWKS